MLLLALYPILTVDVPALVDYPNHLARMHILSAIDSTPALQENYTVRWALYPNLAMDLIVPLLAKVMPIYDAGRLFIGLTMVVLAAGGILLHLVLHGRLSVSSLLVYFLLYSYVLNWGFLNYLFGLGVALMTMAGWIALRERGWVSRTTVFSIAALVLFVVHLIALGIYGLCLFAYEVGQWRSNRERERGSIWTFWAPVLAPFVLPALLWLMVPKASEGRFMIHFTSLPEKLVAFLSAISFNLDNQLFLVDGLAIWGVLLLVWWCQKRGLAQFHFARSLLWPIGALGIFFLLVPDKIFWVTYIDIRIPLFGMLLLVAASRVDFPNGRALSICALAIVGLFAVRIVAADHVLQRCDRDFREFANASHSIEEGSRVLFVQNKTSVDRATLCKNWYSYAHMGALAIIERSIFLPFLFSGGQPVWASERNAPLDLRMGTPIKPVEFLATINGEPPAWAQADNEHYSNLRHWANWPDIYDYVVWIHFGMERPEIPIELESRHKGSYFDIYEINP